MVQVDIDSRTARDANSKKRTSGPEPQSREQSSWYVRPGSQRENVCLSWLFLMRYSMSEGGMMRIIRR